MQRFVFVIMLLVPLSACSQSNAYQGPDSGTGMDGGLLDAGGHDAGGNQGLCPPGICNVATNAGCASGMHCAMLVPNAGQGSPMVKCVIQQNETDGGVDGAGCFQDADCAPGYGCAANQCRKICCGNDDTMCPTGQYCLIDFQDPNTGASLGFGACTPGSSCDFIAQTGCGSNETCFLANRTGGTICVGVIGNLNEGDSCTPGRADACGLGLQCLTLGSQPPACVRYCDFEASDAGPTRGSCPSGQLCEQITVANVPNAGVCLAAM